MSTLEGTPPATAPHDGPVRRFPWWAEALGLLLAPGLVALLLRRTPMSTVPPTRWTAADPDSTAYAHHGADLVERLGVGQALPVHLALFDGGDVGGDVLLRYLVALLATVPAYLWLRRRSLPAGALAVVVILTSPVVLTAWGPDRPDGAALACLLAGLPLLALWTTGRRRLLVRGAAGLFLGSAVCAHPAAVPLVLGAILALAASACSRHTGVRRARTRRVAAELAAVMGGLVLATLGALLVSGRVGIVIPTFDPLTRPEQPEELRSWQSGASAWTQRATYLLVPPVVVIAWAWLCRRRRRLLGEWPPRGDAVVVLGSGLGYLAFLAFRAAQGFTTDDSSSALLWAGACLTTALLLSSLSSSWWPVAAVLGSAVIQVEIGTPRFGVMPTGLAIALVVVAAATLGGSRRRSMPMLVVTVGLALLTTGHPGVAYAPEQVRHLLADDGSAGGHPDRTPVTGYATAASVVDAAPGTGMVLLGVRGATLAAVPAPALGSTAVLGGGTP